jgi:2-phosphosulfolactate phosphatase
VTGGSPAVEVVAGPHGLSGLQVGQRACAVIDVLRACTTIAHALDAGARAVVPVEKVDDAFRAFDRLGRDAAVLGGERSGLRVEGFGLGNSPAEYVPQAVAGRTVVLCTSNGSRALAALGGARECVAAAFVNLAACSARLAEHPRVMVVCAGSGARFSLEDFVCAGHLVREIRRLAPHHVPDDGARAAEAAAREAGDDLPAFLRSTDHGRRLSELGFGTDLDLAAARDRFRAVPVLRAGRLVAEGG